MMTEILCTFPNEFYYLSNNLLRSGPPGTVLILEQGNIIVMGHDLRFCRGSPIHTLQYYFNSAGKFLK
jgi:hypothetical protein